MLSLLVTALLASSPGAQQVTGVIGPECAVLEEIRICSRDEDGYSSLRLTVSGRESNALDGVLFERGREPEYKIERVSDGHYRITIGESGRQADTPFFYFTEVDFEARASADLMVVRYSRASEHSCELAPPLQYVGTVDFVAGTATYRSRPWEIAFDYSRADPSLKPLVDISSDRITEILGSVNWSKSPAELCNVKANDA